MTEGERMIWAAAYAAEWHRQDQARILHGLPMSVPAAIADAGEAVEAAISGFVNYAEYKNHESIEYKMAVEMLGEETS